MLALLHRRRALLLVALLSVPGATRAAACCLSSSVFGTGRLAIWEQAAAGVQPSFGATTGRFDAAARWRALPEGAVEDEGRAEVWALLRLLEPLQAFARVPWVLGVRGSSAQTAVGQGVGDAQAGLRWDAVGVGQYAELPGVALTASVVAPTGRRPEQADPLGASATGRGAWVFGLAAAAERAQLPWFYRLELGATLPLAFVRADTGQRQRFGPGVQAALSLGRELWPDVLVLAAMALYELETPLYLDGARVEGSQAQDLTLALSASWKLTSHWTLTANVSSDALARLGLGQNRAERVVGGLGARYGFF